MPTYRTSARNLFRTPSGAVGEAPDGPGGMAALSDDIDAFLGVGGAEYCANAAAMAAIPAGRLFVGKLAYRADLDTVFRYVGIGKTALLANDSTSKWQGWHTPPTAMPANWSSGITGGNTLTQVGLWGISAGRLWFDLNLIITQANWLAASTDLALVLPSGVPAQMSAGSGWYSPGGSTGNGAQLPLVPYTIGTPGQSTTQCRVRVPRVIGSTVPANPGLVQVATAVGAGTANDQILLSFSAPSARVA